MGSSQAEPSTTGWLNTAWFATCRRPRLATPGLSPARREGCRCCDGQQTNQQKGGCNTWGSVHRGPLPGRFSRTASKQATGSLGAGNICWTRMDSRIVGLRYKRRGVYKSNTRRKEDRPIGISTPAHSRIQPNNKTKERDMRWVPECEMGLNLTLMQLSRDNQHTCIASA